MRAEASPNDMKEVENYVKEHYAAPNDDLFGFAKRKKCNLYPFSKASNNYLIDYKLTDGMVSNVKLHLSSIVFITGTQHVSSLTTFSIK